MTRVYRDRKASVHWSAARNEERIPSRGKTAYQLLVYRTFCSSTGLHRISLVRASEETFRTGVFDALEGAEDGCFLGETIRRHPVLPGPAPTRRPAVWS